MAFEKLSNDIFTHKYYFCHLLTDVRNFCQTAILSLIARGWRKVSRVTKFSIFWPLAILRISWQEIFEFWHSIIGCLLLRSVVLQIFNAPKTGAVFSFGINSVEISLHSFRNISFYCLWRFFCRTGLDVVEFARSSFGTETLSLHPTLQCALFMLVYAQLLRKKKHFSSFGPDFGSGNFQKKKHKTVLISNF